MMIQTCALTGIRLAVEPFWDSIAYLLECVRENQRGYVVFCNAYSVACADKDPSYREVLNGALLVCADGVPLVWVCHKRGYRHAERVCGADAMLALCEMGIENRLRHFFFGGKPGVADTLAARLQTRYPSLDVAGVYSPPFRPMAIAEDEWLVQTINQTEPDIVWVGLGSPNQDRWMALNAQRLSAKLVMGVGAAFDFHAGASKRAPQWLQQVGCEWLYRLSREPWRLLGRYTQGNARFFYAVLKDGHRLRKAGPVPIIEHNRFHQQEPAPTLTHHL